MKQTIPLGQGLFPSNVIKAQGYAGQTWPIQSHTYEVRKFLTNGPWACGLDGHLTFIQRKSC